MRKSRMRKSRTRKGMRMATLLSALCAATVMAIPGQAAVETTVTAPYTDGQVCYTLPDDSPPSQTPSGEIRNRPSTGCIKASDMFGPVPNWNTVFARPAQMGQLFVGGQDHVWGYNVGVPADLYVFGNWRSATYQTFSASTAGTLSVTAHINGAIAAQFERLVRTCLTVTQGTSTVQDCFSDGAYTSSQPVRDLSVSGLSVVPGVVDVIVSIETSQDLGAGHLVLRDLVFSLS